MRKRLRKVSEVFAARSQLLRIRADGSHQPAPFFPRARAAMAESITLADQCLREIRTVSYLLHPPELDELGIESALSRYIDGFIQRSGIRVEFEVSPDLGRLPQAVETTFFRIVQECRREYYPSPASLLRESLLLAYQTVWKWETLLLLSGDSTPLQVLQHRMAHRRNGQQLNGQFEIALASVERP